VVYLRRHLVFERWGVVAPAGSGITVLSAPPADAGPDRCAECGARAAGDDAFCHSCGTSLEPRVRSSQ
jgi:hypothetical protein